MAISPHCQEQSPCSLLDALYCEEEHFEDESYETDNTNPVHKIENPSLNSLMLLEQDMFWEDEELISLFLKEKKQRNFKQGIFEPSLISSRIKAVEWILMVKSFYGFSNLTAIYAVNYLDRFLSSFHFDDDKPWTMQLAAVTCLSLAAKVEETYVPLILDLQVEGTKYMFEAKNVQKMELLVLSTLEWKMNPVTPISFLDHIIRRLGLKNHLHWEFFKLCEKLLVSVLPDWRLVGYLPSELATATMLHVIDQIDPGNSIEYQNQLLSVLNITKEKVKDCYELMAERWSTSETNNTNAGKRKYEQMMNQTIINETTNNVPSIPSEVIDSYLYDYEDDHSNSDISNDLFGASTSTTTTTTTERNNMYNTNSIIGLLSLSSTPVRSGKKGRQGMAMTMQLPMPSLARVFVDVVASPR